MKKSPRCAVQLKDNLMELGKRTDLEILRTPLKQYQLFPTGRNPDTAQITDDELKKLVRYWKLHEARGLIE